MYMFPPFFATPTERHDAQLDANLCHLKLHLSPHIQAEEKRQALIDKQNTKLLQRIVDIMTSKKKSFPVTETRRKVMVGQSVLINMQLINTVEPLLTDTSIILIPLYYGQFTWSLSDWNPYKLTSLKWTPL